jgi:hypothetical protein
MDSLKTIPYAQEHNLSGLKNVNEKIKILESLVSPDMQYDDIKKNHK